MKICKKCNLQKLEVDFYKQKQVGNNGQIWPYLDCYCKSCRLKASSDRSRNVKIKAIEYLGGKCKDCGLQDDPCVFDFHHTDPTQKELTLASRGGRSFKSIKAELDKCELLCANCHRKRHSKQVF